MIVTYWGVRGSVPTPGPHTVRFGGNTSCVAVELGPRLLVLDAGTGIRELGSSLAGSAREVYLLFTHRHADHLQGLPFFAPLYDPAYRVHLLDLPYEDGWTALEIFDGVHMPLRPAQLSPGVERVTRDAPVFFAERDVVLRRLPLRHPGGAFGYRIEQAGRSFVHLTDSELECPGDDGSFFDRCAAFCRGADLLSHDSQYLSAELPQCQGWGHSSVERVCDLALAAGVKRLVLFHHDPGRTDAQLEEIESLARERLGAAGIACSAAYEGLRIEL